MESARCQQNPNRAGKDLAEDLRRAGYTVAGGPQPGKSNHASNPENLFSVLLFLTAIPKAFR